ncbi:phosphoethanolamine transferase [Avibacterium avium]|uniref:phosphoethanolamine transferase n=1 Tax=Avibacterium avium TaxID=751 RepID=UPI003BF8AC44
MRNTNVGFIGFYLDVVENFKDAYKYIDELNNSKDNESIWNISEVAPKYDNYILIIGESARKDYMSVYGYPYATTPFLDTTKGLILDGYVAAALNTQPSLRNTLYFSLYPGHSAQDNIVTLANQAGFETIWISNQGRIGKYESSSSRVASNANQQYFSKYGSYDSSDITDHHLIDILKNKLSKKTNRPRLFVIHLLGSHPNPCKRIQGSSTFDFKNEFMSCYLESIKQTDEFISDVIGLFKNMGSYSLIYFSDHGLKHAGEDDNLVLYVGNEFKQNYEVPFVLISSDDIERKVVKVDRSARRFIYGFAEWLGIKEEHLENYQFFSEIDDKNIEVYDGEKFVSFDSRLDDPAKY